MGLKNIIYIGLSGDNAGFTVFDEIAEVDDEAFADVRAKLKPEDDGLILFTSGTTNSVPHAVVGSQYSRVNNALCQAKDLKTTPSDRFCVAMPIFHCFCLSVNVCAALFSGACLCLPKSRHIKDLLDTVETERCTILSCVPALYHAIISKEDLSARDISSLRVGIIGGSPYSSALFEEIEQTFGFTLLSSLGQTEATAGITIASFDDPLGERSCTVGHFMDNIEYRFVERFELLVRGYVVMKEYYKDAEGTTAAIDKDGWLHTGDTGFVNENGNLVLTGRLKELIIRGGENISPREIEAVFDDDERVLECKALGVYDPHYGEEVALAIIRNGATVAISKDEVLTMLKRELANYKIPKHIVFMNDFPRTSTGKAKTSDLKRQVTEILGL
ncbi:MAG: AMP-binding protein [Clostridia bacterium]|nr:AMP-binding protein [Clostridia bacterium]